MGGTDAITGFSELYRRHVGDVYRFLVWLGGDREEAQDLTAETFARAWAGADGLRLETVKAYLLAIARNLWLEARRRQREAAELDHEWPDDFPDPERTAAGRQRFAAVARALRQLPELDRAALLLRCEEGLAYEEIARILDISAGAARVKVHRARLRLLTTTTAGSDAAVEAIPCK